MQPLLTALLSLTGVLIGASVTFLVGWLRLRHERQAQWQKFLHEAAAEYAIKLGGASEAVRYAILTFEEGHSLHDLQKGIRDAKHLIPEVRLLLLRLRLLFGEDSSVSKAAGAAIEDLDKAITHLPTVFEEETTSGLESAKACQKAAGEQEREFLIVAAQEIRKAGA